MKTADIRRKKQLEFLNSNVDIEVGSLEKFPMSLVELLRIDENSDCVQRYFNGGLTAEVFKLKVGGKYWTLKKRRADILVKNIDGKTSFLNEVQRRRDYVCSDRHRLIFWCLSLNYV